MRAMKHGKKPTRAQRDFIKAKRLTPDSWLVVKDTPEKMVLVHRHALKTIRVIRKDAVQEETEQVCPCCGQVRRGGHG